MGLESKSESELETLLQSDKSAGFFTTARVLRELIRNRHVEPRARHYKALILANADASCGKPSAVRRLLQEMEDNNIAADSGTLHAALQALAVHPDYLIRQEVLQKLRDRWLTLSPAGWHFVVVGLLREHQFEMALDQVALMERKEIPIENWLHSSLIYHLCEVREFDEVYRLMRSRIEQGHDITPTLWRHVLNQASMADHYALTRYVWQRTVDLGYLHPQSKVCSRVLELAALAGDAEQAKSVFRYIASSEKLSPRHENYASLAKANLGAGDLATAFDVLCSMYQEGMIPEETETEPILAYMIRHKTDHREAWQMLKRLKNAKRDIPLASVHIIAKLCRHYARNDPSVVEDAIGFYKELYTLCPDGADVEVYNTLIWMCRSAGNRTAGMFLVKEMASLNVIPNANTFESIVLMCLDAGNYLSANMYFQDLIKREGSVTPGTQKQIRKLCAQSVDEYAMRLQYHPKILEEQVATTDGKPGGDATTEAEKEPRGFGRTKLVYKARVAYNRERRRRKRGRAALERYEESLQQQETEGTWEDDFTDPTKSGE
ncbi:Pentatricopeptide repeat protein [Penicillium cinerascens]|uniref:Pentatricopeptide repeat protein n=1 Tax=Penicillium cinerascens TaxID=70096 RepID=A0A9W9N9F4_9EURO|nr:Pentatricopeptide repeat protein [Penicillium cinerascens]KAJ5215611.1 Pentatricopeptide repeat protein [Penicillium cinerascens]